ncbi:MAG: PaaI family thioesterase [Candidatus Hydrogenedentota bacterium]
MEVERLNTPGVNKFANMMGIHFLEIADGRAEAEIEIREDHFHPGGIVHGGVAYSLADTVMAMTTLSTCKKGENASTVECKMSYMAPCIEGVMKGEAWIVKRGRRIVFVEAKISVGEKVVATATATFMIVEMK